MNSTERKEELKKIIADAQEELKQLNNYRVAGRVRCEMITSIYRGKTSFSPTEMCWIHLLGLAKELYRGNKDFNVITPSFKKYKKYKKIEEMPAEDFEFMISMLDEIIPIWNKYFLEANKEFINEAKGTTKD